MQFPREINEDRPVFTQNDEDVLRRARLIVEKLPQTVRIGAEKVPLTFMLVTFAIAKALNLKVHIGYDIVYPQNVIAWYWLVTNDDAYIDLDPRLIRGTDGPVMIHPSHPFRNLHFYHTRLSINSYNMFFGARGTQGVREEETIEEIIGHIRKIQRRFPSSALPGPENKIEISEIVVPV